MFVLLLVVVCLKIEKEKLFTTMIRGPYATSSEAFACSSIGAFCTILE